MADTKENAKEDLAFLREMARESEAANEGTAFGIIYCAAGVLYGLQCILNYILMTYFASSSALAWILVGTLPTVIFLIVIFRFIRNNRSSPFGVSTSNRAISAAFAGGGVTSAVLGVIFALTAYQQESWVIWLMFPIIVCALQGGAWFTAAIVRRRAWYGAVSAGWFLAAILLGAFAQQTTIYLLILGLFLLFCMAMPGYVIMRDSRERGLPQT